MITNTKTRRVSPVGEVISSWRQRLHLVAAMVLMLVGMLVPQGAWADNSGLDEAFVGDKQYYVLRSSADWDKFSQLVKNAQGESEVNAIMDADFTIKYTLTSNNWVGLDAYPYNGTFNGNGHTLTVDVDWGSNYFAAPFPTVKNATFCNLKISGTVKGGQHSAGLVGHVSGSNESIKIENLYSLVQVSTSSSYAGGLIGHAGSAKVTIEDCNSYG